MCEIHCDKYCCEYIQENNRLIYVMKIAMYFVYRYFQL